MSSVSGVGGGLDLTQLLQQLNGTNSTASTASLSATDTQQVDAAQPEETQPAGHHHHGHHGLHNKIESAVTSALQSADSSEDPNQVVQDAIAGVLKVNGQEGNSAGAANSNGQAPGAQASSGAANVSNSDFAQLLKSYGIDSQQFQNDLQEALGGTNGNGQSIDFSKLFQSFPPGSAIDATA